MKKFLIVAAMIAASVTLSAQQKGDFSVGGALGVGGGSNSEKYTVTANGETQSDKSSAPTTTNFILAPMFNYFVIDNLELSAKYLAALERYRREKELGFGADE